MYSDINKATIKVDPNSTSIFIAYFYNPNDYHHKYIDSFIKENLSRKYPNIPINGIDVNKNKILSLDIKVTPTFKIYQNIAEIDEVIGENLEELENKIKKYSEVQKLNYPLVKTYYNNNRPMSSYSRKYI